MDEIFLVRIVLTANLDESRGRTYAQPRTVPVSVAAENSIHDAVAINAHVASATGRFKIVIFNHTTVEGV